MAAEQGLSVDEPGFRGLMAEQRDRAKADARSKKGQHADTTRLPRHPRRARPDRVARLRDARDRVAAARPARPAAAPAQVLGEGEIGELVLDRTPFYAESGGQAADAGIIDFDGGRLEVLDVQRPVTGLVVHQVRVVEGEFDRRRASCSPRSTPSWRIGARQAHSGTHVVHAALREVLGPTALQSGSYNRPGYLRLDFGWTTGAEPRAGPRHRAGLQPGAARRPAGGLAVHDASTEAKEWGAIALFGETYDDTKVRVVEIGGPWSRELCGGTHVDHSSQIGTIVVTGEASRRVRQPPDRGVHRRRGLRLPRPRARRRRPADRACSRPSPTTSSAACSDLVERLRVGREGGREGARRSQLLAGGGRARGRGGRRRRCRRGRPPRRRSRRRRRTHAGARRARPARPPRDPVRSSSSASPTARSSSSRPSTTPARARGVSANDLVRAVGPLIGGKGGGKADVAQGGGTDATRLDEALALVATEVARAAGA